MWVQTMLKHGCLVITTESQLELLLGEISQMVLCRTGRRHHLPRMLRLRIFEGFTVE